MTAKKKSVGASLEAWCTKCKEDRGHVVEALKSDGTVGKVRCGFCDGSHLYRRPKGDAAAGKAAAGSPRKRASKTDSTFTEADVAKAKPYAMDRDFAVGEVFMHPKFGPGRVTALRSGGKMDVAFGDGVRLLVCRDTGSPLLRRSSRAAVRAPEPVAPRVVPEAARATDDDDDSPAAADSDDADDDATEDDAEE